MDETTDERYPLEILDREDELCSGMDGWGPEVTGLARALRREAGSGGEDTAVRRLMRREPGMRERDARELVRS